MHTSAQPTTTPSALALQYEGQLIEPVSLELDPRTGAHSLRCVVAPSGCWSKRVIAHVPIEPGEAATLAAQALADRLNKAAKQGRDSIALSARADQAVLVLRGAAIEAHEEPGERLQTKPPAAPRVADLFQA